MDQKHLQHDTLRLTNGESSPLEASMYRWAIQLVYIDTNQNICTELSHPEQSAHPYSIG
jgi:hypothetical protein